MKFMNFGMIDKKLLIPIFGSIATIIYTGIILNIPKNQIIQDNHLLQNIYVAL